jgi:hypothetical protein
MKQKSCLLDFCFVCGRSNQTLDNNLCKRSQRVANKGDSQKWAHIDALLFSCHRIYPMINASIYVPTCPATDGKPVFRTPLYVFSDVLKSILIMSDLHAQRPVLEHHSPDTNGQRSAAQQYCEQVLEKIRSFLLWAGYHFYSVRGVDDPQCEVAYQPGRCFGAFLPYVVFLGAQMCLRMYSLMPHDEASIEYPLACKNLVE